MPEPIGPRSSEPPTIDLEPVVITGRLRGTAVGIILHEVSCLLVEP